jgi:hypothetical protein
MQEVQALIAEMQRNTTVVGSVLDFVNGLQAKLTDIEAKLAAAGVSAQDLSDLKSLRDTLAANDDKLAFAVVQGTPAANGPVQPAPVDTATVQATAPAADAAPAADTAAPAAPADTTQTPAQ